MGNGQSSTTGTNASNVEVKVSYYELLGIERSATDDEVKKAYRRKALELHPDRNYGNVESATALFAEVQSAYEVLSDPQERAWYDSHEASILRGDDPTAEGGYGPAFEGSVKLTSADDIARMIRKFNSKVEFTDSPSGFFGFLSETFEQLSREEEVAARLDGSDIRDYPPFGHKDDQYADVVKPFYTVWTSFATQKSFKWKDRYRLSEAPDRQYRRLMQKENQKLRDEAIREFNDAVRSLVAFVRKRDPRVEKTEQSEAERQRVLQEAAKAQAARARKRNEELLNEKVPEWAQVAQKDDLEGDIEDTESEEEHFECVACRKTFKSEKQWEAHERSKKHQKAIQGLEKKMRKENEHLNLSGQGSSLDPGDEVALDDGQQTAADVDPNTDEVGADSGLEQKVNDIEISSSQETPKDEHSKLNDVESDEERESDDSDFADISAVKERLVNGTVQMGTDSDTDDAARSIPQPKMGKAAQKRAKKAAAAAAAAAEGEAIENKFKCGVCNAAFPSKRQMFQHIEDNGHALLKEVGGAPARGKGKKGKR